ncbi:hypothetical protein F5Y13DRAFT_197923 [Hypoxylon sp. FL1857]|nr:hypothetical protein F5Y13DRAFT_197923 [Hypoxylon sp. FL1857]
MVQGSKENLLFYTRGIDRYADDGECTRFPQGLGQIALLEHLKEKLHDWISRDRTEDNVFHYTMTLSQRENVAIPHELLEELRDRKRFPCISFFGEERLYFGRDERVYSTKTKFMVLLCSMIVQLVKYAPDTFEDPTGALTEERFDDLNEMGATMGDIPYSIPKLIEIVKALAAIGPQDTFFFFEGCNRLLGRDEDLRDQLTGLVYYLKKGHRTQPELSENKWKIVWVNSWIPPPRDYLEL